MNIKILDNASLNHVASVAARMAVQPVMENIADIVRHEMLAIEKKTISPSPETPATPYVFKFPREFVKPTRKPANDLTKVLFAVAAWKTKKGGECLGEAVMVKQETGEKLYVSQFGQECGLLWQDRNAATPPVIGVHGRIDQFGTSVWKDFKTTQGVLERVVAKLKAKGWETFQPSPRVQLTLVDAV